MQLHNAAEKVAAMVVCLRILAKRPTVRKRWCKASGTKCASFSGFLRHVFDLSLVRISRRRDNLRRRMECRVCAVDLEPVFFEIDSLCFNEGVVKKFDISHVPVNVSYLHKLRCPLVDAGRTIQMIACRKLSQTFSENVADIFSTPHFFECFE